MRGAQESAGDRGGTALCSKETVDGLLRGAGSASRRFSRNDKKYTDEQPLQVLLVCTRLLHESKIPSVFLETPMDDDYASSCTLLLTYSGF